MATRKPLNTNDVGTYLYGDSGSSENGAPNGTPQRQDGQPAGHCKGHAKCNVWQTTAALLTLQLGWGLWLLPADFARLGWVAGSAVLVTLCRATWYSGWLFTRLYQSVPRAVILGDIGEAAAKRVGRTLVYLTIYSLDATRCIILHLAATQSLFHAISPLLTRPLPLWQCSLVVAGLILALGQIRYLTQLSFFFLIGTSCQLIALSIVLWDLISHPGPPPANPNDAPNPALLGAYRTHTFLTSEMASGDWTDAAMAVLNMIFAFGGQFAYLELLTSMHSPGRFPGAVALCTSIMTAIYGGIGSVGYWSKRQAVQGIVIFNMRKGAPAQVAAGLILFQALAQYLANLNVWSHNLLVLLRRASDRFRFGKRAHPAAAVESGDAASGTGAADPLLDHEDANNWQESHDPPPSTGDHKSSHWFAATAFVAAYSAVISVAIPFFTTLVGFVTSVTYLTCAYTLPAWFTLKLVGPRLTGPERALLWALIPVTLALSGTGFVASIRSYLTQRGGGEGF